MILTRVFMIVNALSAFSWKYIENNKRIAFVYSQVF